MDDLTRAGWRKSSRSGAGNECVEVTRLPDGHRAIRDSKDPAGSTLRCTPAAWVAFTTAIGTDEFV